MDVWASVPFFIPFAMHIVEIPSFFPPYGGEFCLEQAKALQALGHRVAIVSNVQLSVKKSVPEFITLPYRHHLREMDGVSVYQSYMRGIPKCYRLNAERWIRTTKQLFAEYVAANGKPDVIHAHCCKWAGCAAMQLSAAFGIPYIITEHLSKMIYEQEFGPDFKDCWFVPMLREAYEHADRVVTVSEELVESLAPVFGKDYRWKYIPNMIDTDFFAYRERQREEHGFRFCCLANFWPLKGYDVLLDAFDQLPAGTTLDIAGGGTDSKACRQMIAAHRRHHDVHPHGRIVRQAVRDLLYNSDALVLASKSEVQPLSLMEAMSTGIPVIATEVTPRSLRIGEGCHIVPIGDADALARMMEKVGRQDYDGREVSEIITRRFSPKAVARELEQLFQEVVEG